MTVADPTLEFEAELHAGGARYVIGCDEVGRGAIAGPVAVGLCIVISWPISRWTALSNYPATFGDVKAPASK